jgi:hypothetical protein
VLTDAETKNLVPLSIIIPANKVKYPQQFLQSVSFNFEINIACF